MNSGCFKRIEQYFELIFISFLDCKTKCGNSSQTFSMSRYISKEIKAVKNILSMFSMLSYYQHTVHPVSKRHWVDFNDEFFYYTGRKHRIYSCLYTLRCHTNSRAYTHKGFSTIL